MSGHYGQQLNKEHPLLYADLEVVLITAYTFVPLAPAAAAAIFAGIRFSQPWWIRGIVASVISGGIPLWFMVGTKQLTTEHPEMHLAIFGYAVIGFIIGMSATCLKKISGPN